MKTEEINILANLGFNGDFIKAIEEAEKINLDPDTPNCDSSLLDSFEIWDDYECEFIYKAASEELKMNLIS
jgi:hypothetical protein